MSGFSEYDAHDATGLATLVRQGAVTPAELLEEAIARAERVNPRINAIVIPMYERARDRARESLGGPFAGVPFLLKDLGSEYAGVPLQGGSRLYRGQVPTEHGELVRRYLDAGLVVFGKTNTSELGILPVTETELYGPVHNPWRYGITAGGSSGGAAAAVASGIVPMAHGADGGGSIRIPAACCGLFGLKPSGARMPVGPHEVERFFGFSIEHVITRTVRDSAAALDATAGDEPTSIYFPRAADGFLKALEAPPRSLRIGFTDLPLLPAPTHPEATRAVITAAELCETFGHRVEEARPSFDAEVFAEAFFFHFAVGVASELRMASEALHRPITHRDVENSTWLLAMIGRGIDAGEFVTHRRKLLAQAARVVRFFSEYDVLLTPSLGEPPLAHGALNPAGFEANLRDFVARTNVSKLVTGPWLGAAIARAYHFTPYTMVFNVTGQPSASVPLHWTPSGLPFGTMITARPGDETTILQLAAQLEEAQPWFDRRAPIHAGREMGAVS